MTVDRLSCAIGLDVGGTKMAAGVVDLVTGQLLARSTRATQPQRGGQVVLDDALSLVEQLLAQARAQDWAVNGVGVSVCELVDLDGNVTSAHAVDWPNRPVRE